MNRLARLAESLLKSRFWPGIFQWPILLFFVWLVWELLFGTPFVRRNIGLSLVWYLWWPMLPLVFLFFARLWCAVCPFGLLTDITRKFVGNNLPIPYFLRKYGSWLIYSFFALLIFVELATGIIFSPKATAILVLFLMFCAVASGAFFVRRAWCRYLCPLGGMASLFSRFSFIKLESTPSICRSCKTMNCYKGRGNVPGCPVFLCIKVHDTHPYCSFCGNCLKNCENDSIRLKFVNPLEKIWAVKRPVFEESVFVFIFFGIICLENVMFKKQHWAAFPYLEDHYILSAALGTAGFISVAVFFMFLASWCVSKINKQSVRDNVARYGYALIPLIFANHMALTTVTEFLHNGLLSAHNAVTLLDGMGVARGSMALASSATVHGISVASIILGAMLSIYLAYRIAKKNRCSYSALPYVFMIVAILPINLMFYGQPRAGGDERIASLYGWSAENLPDRFSVPNPEDAPKEIREQVMLGYRIMENVQKYVTTADYTHSRLSCSGCHFDGGMRRGGLNGGNTLVGVSVRNLTDEELNRKSNICFVGCMNGDPLSGDAPEMKALNAYYRWISKDVFKESPLPNWYGIKKLPILKTYKPSTERGEILYGEKCASCHHMDGQGSLRVPPLWGENSYNTASSMHQQGVFSHFIYTSMPLDHPTLNQKEALDITEFVHIQPIPIPPPDALKFYKSLK